MKNNTLIMAGLLAAAAGMNVNAGEAAKSSRMDRSKLQIGTYYLHPVAQDEAHIKAMKECGIDFVFGVGQDRREALDLLQKYGIGVVAEGVFPGWGGGDGRYAGQLEKKHPLDEYVKRAKAFKDHPAIWMVDVGDEPSALEFPYYAKLIPEIRKYLPKDVTPYLNLYPNYAQVTKNSAEQQISQLGTATYREHVERYGKEIPLDYLSYDFYVYSAPMEEPEVFYRKFYENLIDVADVCRRTNRSFWFIPQVNNVYEGYHMSLNRLRFQAYSAMAFGAEVINWACWMKGWWNYNIVNPDGTTNEFEYYILKKMNKELHTIGPRYMKYRNIKTEFVDFPTNSVVAELGIKHQPSFAWGPISELTNWPGGPLLIGEMVARDGGNAKAIFVSSQNDYRDAGAPTRWVNFKAKGKVRVTKGSGDWPIHEGDNGFYAFPLDASEGVLVEVE